MNPKALFASILLLATLIQLAPTVYGCVNFFAAQDVSNGHYEGTWLDGKLWDNPDSSGDPSCTLDGTSPFTFNCAAGYSGSLDPDYNFISYNTPHGDYTFGLTYNDCGGSANQDWCSTIQACALGCANGSPDCFAFGCTQPGYSSCGP